MIEVAPADSLSRCRRPPARCSPAGGGGVGYSLVGRVWKPAAAPFDPSTLPHTGLWLAGDYTAPGGAGTWVGTASTGGGSGGRDLTGSAGSSPSVGAPLDGQDTVDFVNDADRSLSNALAVSNFITSSTFSFWALLYLRSTSTGDGGGAPAAYLNAQLAGDSGGWWGEGVRHTDSPTPDIPQFVPWQYSGASPIVQLSYDAWVLVQMKHTDNGGTGAATRTNKNAFSVGSGNPNVASLAGNLYCGKTPFGARLDAKLAAMGISDQAFSNADFDNIYDGVKALYPSAGLP